MQHPQQPYGSRLREFHARHGITPNRDQSPPKLTPYTLNGSPPRRTSAWRTIAWAIVGTIAFVVWMMVCLKFYMPEEIPGNEVAQPPAASR